MTDTCICWLFSSTEGVRHLALMAQTSRFVRALDVFVINQLHQVVFRGIDVERTTDAGFSDSVIFELSYT